jgi:hypothetical protein
MFKKIAIGLAAAALATLASSAAFAGDGHVGVGAHFTWDNYSKPIVSTDAVDQGGGSSLLSSTGYGAPNFGGELQLAPTRRLAINVSLDFGFFSHKVYPYPGNSSGVSATTTNFWQVGALLGVKYFFRDPAAGKVSLYLAGGVGKYFAGSGAKGGAAKYRGALKSGFYDQSAESCTTYPDSCDNNGDKLEGGDLDDAWQDFTDSDEFAQATAYDKAVDKELEAIGKLSSPVIVQLAVGAEFFATDTFSLGADILGVRFAFASADVGKAKDLSSTDPVAVWSGKQNYIDLYIYSALTMSFNLTGGSSQPAPEPAAGGASWGGAPTAPPAEQAPVAPQPGQGEGWGEGWGTSWSAGPAAPAGPAQPVPPPPPAPAAPKAPATGGTSAPPPPPPPPPGY